MPVAKNSKATSGKLFLEGSQVYTYVVGKIDCVSWLMLKLGTAWKLLENYILDF